MHFRTVDIFAAGFRKRDREIAFQLPKCSDLLLVNIDYCASSPVNGKKTVFLQHIVRFIDGMHVHTDLLCHRPHRGKTLAFTDHVLRNAEDDLITELFINGFRAFKVDLYIHIFLLSVIIKL